MHKYFIIFFNNIPCHTTRLIVSYDFYKGCYYDKGGPAW
jgi:hypothetical protein